MLLLLDKEKKNELRVSLSDEYFILADNRANNC